MNILSIILSAATFLLVLSQLLCGLWMRSKGSTPEGARFHARLGIGSSITALVTVAVMLVVVLQR